MKLLCQPTTAGTVRRLAMRTRAVSAASVLPTSAASSRPIHSHSSLYDATVLPRAKSSLGEPGYYSAVASAMPQELVTEFDYGYRVQVESSTYTPRLYTTTTALPSSALAMDHPDKNSSSSSEPVDEYAFIMSSPDPVSAQECSSTRPENDSSFFFTAEDRQAWNSLAHHESEGMPEQQVILDANDFEWEESPTQENWVGDNWEADIEVSIE